VDEVDAAIGARIRLRRNELGLTQEQLADALGVTYQQVQKYERGVDRISVSMLMKIAKRLDGSVAALIGEAPGAVRDDVAPRLAVPGAAELLDIYAKIESPTTRKRLLDLLSDLAAESPIVREPEPAPPRLWRRGVKRSAEPEEGPRPRSSRKGV
jgi:transcriptional regulator with XRE-family HTH domain